MDKRKISTIKTNKRLFGILITIAFLLLIPLIAMQFTDEVKWTPIDFITAGILLLLTGLTLELIFRNVKTTKCKIIAIVFLFLLLFLIWAELAVGIFGTPFAGD